MKTAIIVSGVVRNMIESSYTWKFKGDYYLVGDEYIYNRKSVVPNDKLVNKLTDFIQKTNIEFTSILIPSRKNIDNPNIDYHSVIINMLWKWKCAYYLILSYDKVLNYDKYIFIRPDMYISEHTNYDYIDNFKIDNDVIYTTSFPHTVNKNGIDLMWVNDLFLIFNKKTFFKISQLYDFYVKSYKEKKLEDIHTLLGVILKKMGITVHGGFINYTDFVILTDNVVNTLFQNNRLIEGYSYDDVVKKINEEYG